MMIIDLIGRWGDVLETVSLPALCVSISIREGAGDDRKEHFPGSTDLLEWDKNRKISDLPEPPPEVR